jgi:tetratricopeptide (TPR) repeat protein
MRTSSILSIIFFYITLSSCVNVEIPPTDDPIEKLEWAEDLYDFYKKPVDAEKLIREAIVICEQTKDNSCLGNAYVNYGFFFRSPSIREWEDYYRENGFLDKTATYDTRMSKSKQYFEKAVSSYEKTDDYSALSRAYLNLGFSYYFLNGTNQGGNAGTQSSDNSAECEAYASSLKYNLKTLEENPDANISLPEGVSSFREYIAIHQKRAGCT